MALAYLPLQGWAINELASRICGRFSDIAEEADIIHNVRVGREPISFASLMYARQHGIPIVFTPLHHPRWTTWFHRHYLHLYHQVDAIIALTNYERGFLIGMGIPENRVFVTGTNPVVSDDPKPEDFREKYHIEGPVVLFLGQKYPYKNLKSLLDAALIVWKSHPHVNFVFIGPRTKYSQDLFRSVSDERIVEIGTVDIQEKSDALMACDILCMPSSQESFGSVYLEAWMYGKPVIGGNAPAIQEVIDHEINGFISNPDPAQIARYILTLFRDNARAADLGFAGQQKVLDQYTLEKNGAKTQAIYQMLLSHR